MDVITKKELDLVALLQQSHCPTAGAVVLFSGEVRNHNSGKQVKYLEYEAHTSMATKMIDEILQSARTRWNLSIALAQHRIGKVKITESAVVVITASVHRGEAYASNRYVIDRIKHEVPIWKCEYLEDGSKEWGGNCNCHKETGDVNKHVYEFEVL
ncbi:molybdenum cofactor biosynthesis protein MoaE [Pedobacter caeni]|uniref:Molybdopterin synthase catalytic subunit n=1 Tax=Pedobacter caeni TaxID=288992 RepID=A0A1M4U2D8_9SPHI|nr:molybdenum cofactor biosynthesis protein MoaE [Pedobacter caeni]SHE50790.1 molybdopterin synthase subunit MoaE [Pedobacter caeni]